MTAPDQWLEVRMVVGPDTSPADAHWDQQVVVLPPNYPIGSGEGAPGVVLGVRGYTRPAPPGAEPATEFVMTSEITQATIDTVNNIPGPQQWLDLDARQTFYNIGLAMVNLTREPTVSETLQVLTILYGGAKAEVLAEVAAGVIAPPPPAGPVPPV